MTIRRPSLIGCLAVVSITCSACDRNPSNPPPPAATVQEPKPAPVVQSASAAPTAPPAPVSTKPDKVDAASLKAGLSVMTPRVVTSVEGYSKVSPNERSRFFMHPGETKTASIEFDTKGLKSLEMAPFIEDLTPDPGCVGNPQAGVVRLTWFVDGVKKAPLTIDRNYNSTVSVNLANASRLKIEVDKGNGVIWCDWFTIGFLNVQ